MEFNTTIKLATAARITANANGAGVDVSGLTGKCLLVLNASATEAADNTLDVKIQHSDDNATWSDSGAVFNQVTNAAGGSFQTITMDVDGFKKYVRAVDTVAGTTPAVTRSVMMVAKVA
jgi:hypothetical protein